MTLTEQATEEKAGFDLVAAVRAATPEAVDRRFWATLAAATILHLMLLLGFLYAPSERLGDPNAAPNAVAVSFVTEAELMDASAGADGAPPPSLAQPAAQPPPEPQAEQQQEQEAQEAPKLKPSQAEKAEETKEAKPVEKADEAALPEPAPDEEAAVLAQPKAEEEKQQEKQEEKKNEEAKDEQDKAKEDEASELKKESAEARPDLLEVPDLMPQPRRPPARKQQQARRQPSMALPQQTISTPSLDGRAASVSRPAGITRSGANDDFARGVISALRQTMPQMNVLGRVTVKILINMNGNLETVTMLSRSQDTVLNRSVVFSTKQASFPFPPNGATLADRTFTITYIYH